MSRSSCMLGRGTDILVCGRWERYVGRIFTRLWTDLVLDFLFFFFFGMEERGGLVKGRFLMIW